MADTTAMEDIKYCFGTFHDRPLATFKDDESYNWNRELVHECRTCEHLTPCFFISTQVKMSKDESLQHTRGRERQRHEGGSPRDGHGHGPDHHHGPGPHRHHHHGGPDHCPEGRDRHHHHRDRKPPRKDFLDVMAEFVQTLKDQRR